MTDASESIDLDDLREGLRQSAAGETVTLGSFAKYADDIDLDELRRLAEAATPGPWRNYTPNPRHSFMQVVESEGLDELALSREVAEGLTQRDAEFVAAADPQTVLALIERAESAERRIERVREMHRPIDIEPSDTICSECSFQLPNGHFFGKVVEWPCETVKALTEGDIQ